MKKCVLVGINAKYVHTNLAIRGLKAAAPNENIELCEVTINDRIGTIVNKLLAYDADYYGFSCYIWNIEMIIKVSEVLKKSLSKVIIFWGGPEVSYDSKALLDQHTFVDYIIAGEGEGIYPEFLKCLNKGDFKGLLKWKSLKGRSQSATVNTLETETLEIVEDLETLAFPYNAENIGNLKNKIIYYESMRGCPYQCSYCLSSTLKKVRFLPLERVFKELDFFIDHKVNQVKFVDRTFNVDLKRTKAIIAHLVEKGGVSNFHFEIAGDLLDDELLDIIKKAPKGLMQFEIGVQSTNTQTLEAIVRKTNLAKIENYVKRLIAFGNCHVHLDLIVGLPEEDYTSFKTSFNRTMAIRPQMLQVGFLKLLKGTKIRKEASNYHYAYTSFPPYEVIQNDFMDSKTVKQLKDIEGLVDRYYNSGAFYLTLEYLFENGDFGDIFSFFESFSDYWKAQDAQASGKSKEDLYQILKNFMDSTLLETKKIMANELLKLDYLCQGYRSLPLFFENKPLKKEACFEVLKDEAFIDNNLSVYKGQSAKQIIKKVYFQHFDPKTLNLAQSYGKTPITTGELCLFSEGNFIRIP